MSTGIPQLVQLQLVSRPTASCSSPMSKASKTQTATSSHRLTSDQVTELIENGIIAGGMIPKTETALKAVVSGVKAVVIMNGQQENACLLGTIHNLWSGVDDPRLTCYL